MRKQQATEASSRPFTVCSFDNKINLFNKYLDDLTYFHEELNPSEREKLWQERITNGYIPFLEFVRSLFGDQVEARNVKSVFRRIATSPDVKVDWSELFGVNDNNLPPQGEKDVDSTTQTDRTGIFKVDEKRTVGNAGGDKRSYENVQCMTYCPVLNIYVTVTLHGIVCQWNSRFRFKSSIQIAESTWVTGCCTLPDLKKIVVSTERSIVIWEYRMKGKDKLVLYIKPIENPPQCLIRLPWKNIQNFQDSLVFGDDQGCLNVLTINAEDLKVGGNKNSKEPGWNILEPSKLKNAVITTKIHNDWVSQLKYLANLQMLVSCSASNQNSLVLSNLDYLGDERFQRSLSLPKGINCFSYCTKANAIVTGGVDKILRIWHPLILTRPTGKLLGHVFTIVDVTVNERDQHVISVSSALIFRVWDIQRLTCLQVLVFAESQSGESKSCCIFYCNKHEFLVTGTNIIEVWPLAKTCANSIVHPRSHEKSITCILFNEQMNQVATTCKDCCLKIWEIETGQMIHSRPQAHGSKSRIITSMSTDVSGQKLMTGATDGSIYVWDFVNAQLLKKFDGLQDEVSKDATILDIALSPKKGRDLVFVTTRRKGITVLLDRQSESKLTKLSTLGEQVQISIEETEPTGDTYKKASHDITQIPGAFLHSEVVAVDTNLEVNLLALGFSDGAFHVWDVITQSLVFRSNGTNQRSGDKVERDITTITLAMRCSAQVYQPGMSGVSRSKTSLVAESPFVTNTSSPENMEVDTSMLGTDRSLSDLFGIILVGMKSGQMEIYNIEGDLLASFSAFPSAIVQKHVTRIIRLDESFQLASGDSYGFITLWDLRKLSNYKPIALDKMDESAIDESLQSHIKRSIEQTLSWRAHMSKVTDLVYVPFQNVIISSSTDSSVRVWHGSNGHFIGYFGQDSMWNLGKNIDIPISPEKPYDIVERSLKPVRGARISMEQAKPVNTAKIPLAFDSRRWTTASCPPAIPSKGDPQYDKKFFSSLSKPRHYNSHLEFSTTASTESGAVFRSLPVYKIENPKRLKTPAVSLKEPSWLRIGRGPTHIQKKKHQSFRLRTSKKEETPLTRFPHLVSGKK